MSNAPRSEPPGGRFRRASYSQFGEDRFVLAYFGERRGGTYVDVGCFDAWKFSNTALLHVDYGWRGLNIDASPRAVEALRAARPEDRTLLCGVGEAADALTFHIFERGTVSTFDAEAAARLEAAGEPVIERRKVPVRSLGDILEEAEIAEIDFLDVDCEGWDFSVLRSLDWRRWRPKLVSAELGGFDITDPYGSGAAGFMHQQGYELVSYIGPSAFFAPL
ncbi:FkbM family methyltransferase [Pseudoroseicyclus tamaricis]|uniref:FkbM family methyltransferase n=1 Tax=Pseudoroseicyclus tamaricis TaxID=2705421 RepID=A0A6B2JN51_9RHOB|nr:FkbM family methyltransferase [Pseudoroseicyclus tamaricis]NDV00097.1 FkbM family methyltransferase [Pseudoroseicyclus tamaricis]